MDQRRFDTVIRKLGETPRSRRGALRLVAGAALAGLLARAGIEPAVAAGCVKVNKPCRRARHCCSGICKGRKDKKTCRGHGAGTCKQQGQAVACTAQDPALAGCNNHANCFCFQTTAGTNYCSRGNYNECAVCERDADCVKLGFPAGSACAPSTVGRCAGDCESGTACLVPCGFEPPPAEASGRADGEITPLDPLSGNR